MCVRVADLVDSELSRFHSIITAALSESKDKVSDVIGPAWDGFPLEVSHGLPGTSTAGSTDYA